VNWLSSLSQRQKLIASRKLARKSWNYQQRWLQIILITTEDGNCDALQLENRQTFTRPTMHQPIQSQHFRNLDPDFLSDTDILTIDGHLPVFWLYFNRTCSKTAIFELWFSQNFEIVIGFVDCNVLNESNNNLAIRRRFQVLNVFFHCTDKKNLPQFYFRFI